MRKKNRLLSLLMVCVFAVAFLVPSMSMPATALADPDVDSGYTDSGNLEVATDDADNVEGDEATLWASFDVDEEDYDDEIYEIQEYGFFYGTDEDELDEVEDLLADGDDSWGCDYDEGTSLKYSTSSEMYKFRLKLTDLDEDDETYYFRAYIEYYDENEDETYYSLGEINEFDVDEGTSADKPEVTTGSATEIDADSAVLNGTIDSFGGDDEITEYGFYYGTSSSPTTKKKVGDDDDRLKKGESFDFKLSGLKPDTKYYFKSYARSSEGIGYGSVRNFTTGEDKDDTPAATSSSIFTIGQNFYTLNGSSQVMDAAPYIKNSRTYLPIRYVGYAMGLTDAQIQWYEATRTVILTKGNNTVVLVIGSTTMFVNGHARVMDVAPEITNSRTCLPIAWVASAFGHTAVWNGSTQQVTIAGVTVPGSSKGELKLSRSSLTLEPGDEATITGTLDADIDDVDYELAGDREFSVDIKITGTTFKATIEADSGADDGDEATITFTVTDRNGNEYEADLDVAVEDDSSSEVEVTTSSATSVAKDSARLNGKVSDDGGLDIKRFGFYYGTNSREVGRGEDGDADYSRGKGSESKFYFDLDDLDSNEKYFFMAYAVDEDNELTYGKVLNFTTKK